MSEIDERVAALLQSPLGCAFLLIAAESGLAAREIARPDVALDLGAFAAHEMVVWRADHARESREVLQRGPQHADLARAILEESDTDWWFGPLDRERQVWVTQDGSPPDSAQLVPPTQPPSSHERYAQKVEWPFCTSTLVGAASSWIDAIDYGVGDLRQVYTSPPYPIWLLTVDASARVFEVDGPQAWHDLCVRYPAEGATGRAGRGTPDFSGDKDRLVPDWSAMAADWDGVHLTFGGWLSAEQVRVDSASGWTYHWAWDAEQTMWLRWLFTSSRQMPDHQERSVSDPPWQWLHSLLPQDNRHRGHTTPLRRVFRGRENH